MNLNLYMHNVRAFNMTLDDLNGKNENTPIVHSVQQEQGRVLLSLIKCS